MGIYEIISLIFSGGSFLIMPLVCIDLGRTSENK